MFAEHHDNALALNDLLDEIARRFRRGERPSLDEYLRRHPDLAEDLRDFFPVLLQLEQANADRQAGRPAAPPVPSTCRPYNDTAHPNIPQAPPALTAGQRLSGVRRGGSLVAMEDVAMPSDSSARYVLLNELADEIAQRCRRGERPSLEEYLQRHPDLADDLQMLFSTLMQVEQVKDDRRAEPTPAPAPTLRQLGDYRIVRQVGQGGMGVVYEAEQLSLGRRVALKVLPAQLLASASFRLRFEREARAAGRLHHTNIVPIYGVGEHDGTPYYAMQFIQGQGLDAVLEELRRLKHAGAVPVPDGSAAAGKAGAREVAHSLLTGEFHSANPQVYADRTTELPAGGEAGAAPPGTTGGEVESPGSSSTSVVLPGQSGVGSGVRGKRLTYWQSVAQIGAQVAGALEYAHKQGVLHRDVKPSNLLLDLLGTVWITDFGLAKADDQENLTATGDVLGTLRYLAPESFAGKADHRSDVHALGLTLFELAAFRPAYDAANRSLLVTQVMSGQAPRLESLAPGVPRDLATVVHKAIEREPGDRYQTAGDLAEDLHRFLADEPIHARRLGLAERVARWTRHNRASAAALTAVALMLLALTAGSVLAAAYFSRLAGEKESARTAADSARADADAARGLAEQRGDELSLGLYRAEMSLAGQAAFASAGLPQVNGLVDNWRGRRPDPRGWEWYYLRGLGCRAARTLHGHVGPVFTTAWSPDGLRLASGGSDGAIRIWDATTGRQVRTLTGHHERVFSVAWSPDGLRLASCGSDFSVRIWDVAAGKQKAAMLAHFQAVYSVAWSPDGTRLASGAHDGKIMIWDPSPNQAWWKKNVPLRVLRGAERMRSVAWSADGTRLASAGNDGLVHIWDPATGQLLVRGRGHSNWINTVAWSPTMPVLASAGQDAVVRLWDSAGNRIGALRGHEDVVSTAAWAPKGDRLATAGNDHTVRVWDRATSRELYTFRGHTGFVQAVAWAPDGGRLASAGDDGTLRIWDLADDPSVRPLRNPGASILALAWAPDGKEVAALARDGIVRVHDAARGSLTLRLRLGEPGHHGGLAWAPDGRRLAAVVGHWLRVWERQTGREVYALHDATSTAIRVAWSPDGARLATSGWDETVRIRDARSGKVLRGLHSFGVTAVAWSPDGSELACRYADQIQIWHPQTGELNRTLRGHLGDVETLAWRRDGARLASGGQDLAIRVWDPGTCRELLALRGHTGSVQSISWSPDGARLASLGKDHTLRIWDAEAGRELLPLRRSGIGVFGVAWSPDGRRLACEGGESVLILDATPGLAAEHSDRLLPLLEKRLTKQPDSESDRRLRAAIRADRGDWERAETDLKHLVRPGTPRSGTWFQAGWRVGGPFKPEQEPAVAVGGAIPTDSWLPAPAAEDGWLDLRGSLPGEQGAAYALTRVYSPIAQSVTVLLEASGPVRLWADGKLLHHQRVKSNPSPQPQKHPSPQPPPRSGEGGQESVALELPAGWTTLLVRVEASERNPFLRMNLVGTAERAWDRALALLAAERWKEAEEVVDQARTAQPETAPWLDGHAARFAQHRASWLRRSGKTKPTQDAARLAGACFDRLEKARPDSVEVAAAVARFLWEQEDAKWAVLKPTAMASEGNATLTRLPDGSIRVTGDRPDKDVYTIAASTPLTGITNVRLEALPDEGLPGRGPGRADNGNFVLSELRLEALPQGAAGKSIPVALHKAQATFSQDGYAVADAIDDNPATGWAVNPRTGQAHSALFQVRTPLEHPKGSVLTFTLEQRFNGHTLGRFRLSVRADRSELFPWLDAHLTAQRLGDGWADLGAARAFRGEHAAARAALRKGADGPGGTVLAGLLLTLVCDRLNQKEEAQRAFDRAVAWLPFGEAPAELRELAIQAASCLLARQPDNAQLRVQRANWYIEGNQRPAALADLKQAMKAAPRRWLEKASVQLARMGGQAALETKDWQTLAEVLAVQRRVYPQDSGIWFGSVVHEAYRGERAGHRRLCQEMLSRFGQSEDAWALFRTALAGILVKGELEPDAAGRLIDKAIASKPGEAQFGMVRVLASYRKGDDKAAARQADEALRLTATWSGHGHIEVKASIRFVQAMAAWRQGQRKEAAEHLDQGRQIASQAWPPERPGADPAYWAFMEVLRREAEALVDGR